MSHSYPRLSWPGSRSRPTSRPRDFVRPRLEELEPRNLFAVSFGPTASPFDASTPPSSIVFAAVPINTAQNFQTSSGSGFAGQPVLVQAALAQTAPPLPQNQTVPVVSPLLIGPFFTAPAVLEQGNGISTQSAAVLPIPNSPVYSFIPVEI